MVIHTQVGLEITREKQDVGKEDKNVSVLAF